MSVEASKLIAAPLPITLSGKEYYLSPITDNDHEELNQWARAQHVRLAVQAAQGLGKEVFDNIVSMAMREAHSLEWNRDTGTAIASSFPGMVEIMRISLKKKHPEITREKIQDLLKDGESLILAMRAFREVNRVDSKNSETPEASERPTG